MNRTDLPTVGDYLAKAPQELREILWSWLSSLPQQSRRDAHILDLAFPPGPEGYVGEELVPVAEHPRWAIWLVRREAWRVHGDPVP